LADSLCTGFIWNSLTLICQSTDASMLAGDASAGAIEGFIDKSLQPGPIIKKLFFQERRTIYII
jgi:hypothetical protein